MMSPTGLARVDMLSKGITLAYGSTKEMFYILNFIRVRNIQYVSSVAAISSIDGKKILEKVKETYFPEERMKSIAFLKKGQDMMKMVEKDFKIKVGKDGWYKV